MNPGDGAATNAADEDDLAFEAATREIELLHGDLLGVEAVSHALIASYGAPAGQQTPVGIHAHGPASPITYTMPTRVPFQVRPRVADEHPEQVAARLDDAFHRGSRGAAGGAGYLQGLVGRLFGVDAASIESAAYVQFRALLRIRGAFVDDFASIQMVLKHFRGATADSFKDYYFQVDDVMGQLIEFARVAEVGAAGVANVIGVAKKELTTSASSAQTAFEQVLNAWRQDAGNFPFPPGLVEQKVDQFVGLVGQVGHYAEQIPVVGDKVVKVEEGVASAEHAIGVARRLFGMKKPKRVGVQPRAAELFDGITRSLQAKARDADQAFVRLAEATDANRGALESREQLRLPGDHFHLHYT